MRSQVFDPRPGSRWILHDREHVVQKLEQPSAVIMRRLDTDQLFRMSLHEVANLILSGKCKASDAPDIEEHDRQPYFNMARVGKDKLRRVERRIAYVNAIKKYFPIGPRNPALVASIREIAERRKDPHPPSPHTVYRWLNRYVACGYDSTVFVKDLAAVRKRNTGLPPILRKAIVDEYTRQLGQQKGASVRGVSNDVIAAVAAQLGITSIKTIENAVMPLSEYQAKRAVERLEQESKK